LRKIASVQHTIVSGQIKIESVQNMIESV